MNWIGVPTSCSFKLEVERIDKSTINNNQMNKELKVINRNLDINLFQAEKDWNEKDRLLIQTISSNLFGVLTVQITILNRKEHGFINFTYCKDLVKKGIEEDVLSWRLVVTGEKINFYERICNHVLNCLDKLTLTSNVTINLFEVTKDSIYAHYMTTTSEIIIGVRPVPALAIPN